MENYKNTLDALLSTVYGKDKDGVASLLNEDGTDLKPNALDEILNWDKERVSKLKPDTKKIFDDGYKKAQSEVLTGLEKQIKEKFGVESDKKGVELVEELFNSAKASEGQGGKGLTDEDVKKHRAYLDLIEEKNKSVKTIKEEYEQKLKEIISSQDREKTFSRVADEAMTIFDGFKPVLSEDPAKAKNQRSIILRELQNFQYELRDDRVIVKDAEGNELTDGHGNRVPLAQKVREIADQYFEYQASEERGNAGNKGQGKGAISVPTPKTEAEFVKAYTAAAGNPELQIAIKNAWLKVRDNPQP